VDAQSGGGGFVIIRAFIAGPPSTVTAQQKGVAVMGGKPRFYTKKKVKDAHRALVAQLAPHAPGFPFEGQVILRVTFTFPVPLAMRRLWGPIPHSKRPDLDNLLKGVLDALEPAGWMTDDARIYSLHAEKWYGEPVGLQITAEELP
jgi:Holliday junction resolvase RusA-like endonuclease